MGQMRNSHEIFVQKPKRKTLLGRPLHRWEDNNKMDLKRAGRQSVEGICMAQDNVE
jgi:hypothetical protein